MAGESTYLPMVTVLVPSYNEELYIEKCISSIIKNNYPIERLEVFIIDGMSTDGTVVVAQKYTEKYPFIRVLKNDKRIFPGGERFSLTRFPWRKDIIAAPGRKIQNTE